MAKSPTIAPAKDFVDPRLKPGFQPRHWPLCNGSKGPRPRARDIHDRRCIEFLALFYELNVLNSRLLHARARRAAVKTIKPLLRQIAEATGRLEAAEDRYAPVGFFGEPVMDGLQYSNIIFVRPELPRIYTKPSPISSHIAIPGLEEIPESELRGPARILRFGHGKVDL